MSCFNDDVYTWNNHEPLQSNSGFSGNLILAMPNKILALMSSSNVVRFLEL